MRMTRANVRIHGLATVTLLCLIGDAWPQPSTGEQPLPLNSERISQRFGSYGIEVLETADDTRVSNLFSEETGQRITRTFAVVEFQAAAQNALSPEHEAVLAGESIGEALVSRGWTVEKSNRYFGLLPSTSRMDALMKLRSTAMLAVHVYDLRAIRAGEAHHYATIAEVHHPDYLQFRTLREIYGNAQTPQEIEPALAVLWQKMN